MNAFEIIGGKKLKGEITPQGAKNEALQIISAVLLTENMRWHLRHTLGGYLQRESNQNREIA
ncbi:MAG TPA: hypothetical protein VL088_07980 [Pedobacter sp.]|nr:hypothetical protein [Pedobacter sp.]